MVGTCPSIVGRAPSHNRFVQSIVPWPHDIVTATLRSAAYPWAEHDWCRVFRGAHRRSGTKERCSEASFGGSAGCRWHAGLRTGSERRGSGFDPQGLLADRPQHHPLGPVRHRPSAAGRRYAGADVRRPDAAVRQRHERGPHAVLQVGEVRRLDRRARHGRERPTSWRDHRPGQVRRPARHVQEPRRRRLGGWLDRGRGPRAAALAGPKQRVRGCDRRAGARRRGPDRVATELPAQRGDQAGGLQAGRGSAARGARGQGGPPRHQRLLPGDQRLLLEPRLIPTSLHA